MMKFIPVKNKLRVIHIPQVGVALSFKVNVEDEKMAAKIIKTLALQHIWLYDNRFIPDYSNIITVEMLSEESGEWEDYWNDELSMEWEEVETTFFQNI